jgi:hypothetical protein
VLACLNTLTQPEGENKVKGFNWTSNGRVLVCIIAALLFTLWFALWMQYY